MRRIMVAIGLAGVILALGSFSTGTMPPRNDSSRSALTTLGQEYSDLQQWATAVAVTTDTLPTANVERARVLADQLARLMRPLEEDFARTTASLSTAQLETILPLWERMAFAHAGFVLLQEQAAALGGDPALEPAELHQLAAELSAVLDFAAEIQRLALTELTAPPTSPIRII